MLQRKRAVLALHFNKLIMKLAFLDIVRIIIHAGGRIRTSEDTKSQDLKSCAFDRFATPASKKPQFFNLKKYLFILNKRIF